MIFAAILSAVIFSGQGLSPYHASPQAQGKNDLLCDLKIASIEIENAEVREVLSHLFKNLLVKHWVDLDLEGNVTLSMKNVPYSMVLDNVLAQVGGEYAIEKGVYVIRKKRFSPIYEGMPLLGGDNFLTGAFTSTYVLVNPALFKSPLNTKGGTYDLLLEAIRAVKFKDWHVRTFGRGGFALVMPFESINANGRPTNRNRRFQYNPSFWRTVDFQKIGAYFAHEFDPPLDNQRVIVLAAEPFPSLTSGPESLVLDVQRKDLSERARREKWEVGVKVSAFVYEFTDGMNGSPAKLLPSGKGLPARTHLIGAGLWSGSMLR